MTEGLHGSPNMVHKLRAAIYQRLPGQVLSIHLIGLALVGVDEPHLASIGDQHLVTTLFEQPTNPWRVSPGLDGYTQRPLGDEASSEGLGSCAQPALLHN